MLNILIVDDDENKRRKLKEVINATPMSTSPDITFAVNANEAMTILNKKKFDLLILDPKQASFFTV